MEPKNAVDHIGRASRRSAVLTAVAATAVISGLVISFVGTRRSAETALELAGDVAEVEERAQQLEKEQVRRTVAERRLSDGVELASRGRLTEAIALYDQAIDLNPESANAFQFRGYALLRRAQIRPELKDVDLPAAVASLERAVELDPNHIWGRYNLALAYWESGDTDRAVQEVRRVISIDPSFRGVISNDVQFRRFRASTEFRDLLARTSSESRSR